MSPSAKSPVEINNGFVMPKWVAWAVGVFLTLMTAGGIPWVSWVTLHVASAPTPERMDAIDNRVTAIEASRFTAVNGLDVWKEIGEIKADVARLGTGEGRP